MFCFRKLFFASFLSAALCAVLFSGCEFKNGPFYIENKTSEEVNICISQDGYGNFFYTMKAGEVFNTEIDFKTPSVKVLKTAGDVSVTSNKHIVSGGAWKIIITDAPKINYDFYMDLPEELFGEEEIEIVEKEGVKEERVKPDLCVIEKNGKFNEWIGTGEATKLIGLTKKHIKTRFDVSAYTFLPEFEFFSIKNNSTVKTFNGKKIEIIREKSGYRIQLVKELSP